MFNRIINTFLISVERAKVNFYFPWNHQNTVGFLIISGEKKLENSLNIRNEIWS